MTGWDDKMSGLRQRFIDRTAADRALLGDGIRRDRGELELIAHRISGSAGMFGFVELGTAAEELEEAIRNLCDESTLEKHVMRLDAEIDRIQPR
ncbi:MAG TPA: Hpt domain-containing protein [Sphingomicrobium sp.]